MVQHGVVVVRLPAACSTLACGLHVRPEVHVGRVEPQEEGLIGIELACHEVKGCVPELLVDRLHTILVSGPVSSIRWVPSASAQE